MGKFQRNSEQGTVSSFGKSLNITYFINALLDEAEGRAGAPDSTPGLQEHRVGSSQIPDHLFHIALHGICPVPGEMGEMAGSECR